MSFQQQRPTVSTEPGASQYSLHTPVEPPTPQSAGSAPPAQSLTAYSPPPPVPHFPQPDIAMDLQSQPQPQPQQHLHPQPPLARSPPPTFDVATAGSSGPPAPFPQVPEHPQPYYPAQPQPQPEAQPQPQPPQPQPQQPQYPDNPHAYPPPPQAAHHPPSPSSGTGPKTPVLYTPSAAAGPNGGIHAPGQIAHPNQHTRLVEPYKHSLFSCLSEPATCCLGCWCPCMLYSRTHYRLKTVPNSRTEGWPVVDGMCVLWCVASPVSWLLTTLQRTRIRENYRLEGSVVGDCVRSYCCVACTLVQDDREVAHREDERRRFAGPGSGVVGDAGYTRNGGMVYG